MNWYRKRGLFALEHRKLGASREYLFGRDKVFIIDVGEGEVIELTNEAAQVLLDDLIGCGVRPTMPDLWQQRLRFLLWLAGVRGQPGVIGRRGGR